MFFRTVITSIALLSTTGWAQYALEDDYLADGHFFDMFSFFQGGDPTHGSVKYVDQNTARNGGLTHLSNGQVYMGVDHTNVAPNGRPSVRITSNKSYNSGLFILDLAHMPGGICGTWPAFWMVGSDWPNNGEIDIIEGVNDQSTNDMTLHTNAGCRLSSSGSMTGTISTSNCDVNAPGQYANQGCSIVTGNSQTYGNGFNNIGGGVYATEWTSTAIKVYFFPRSAIPSDITNGRPNPASWGSPIALFQGCDLPSHFKNLQLVFDTTFCGDWAAAVWGSSACAAKASSCEAYVANNPSAFADAYWLINSLKVYQPGAWAPSPVTTPAATHTSMSATTTHAAVPTTTTLAAVPTTTTHAAVPTTTTLATVPTTTTHAAVPTTTTTQAAVPTTTTQVAVPVKPVSTQPAVPVVPDNTKAAAVSSTHAPSPIATSPSTARNVTVGPGGKIYWRESTEVLKRAVLEAVF